MDQNTEQPIQPSQQPVQPVPTASVTPPQPQAQPAQPVVTPPQPMNKEANKKSLFLIIGIIILIIILVVLSALLLLRNNSATPTADTITQTKPTTTVQITPIPPKESASNSSDLQQATSVDTGDPAADITTVQQDAAGL